MGILWEQSGYHGKIKQRNTFKKNRMLTSKGVSFSKMPAQDFALCKSNSKYTKINLGCFEDVFYSTAIIVFCFVLSTLSCL
jgi:hypothetical protein